MSDRAGADSGVVSSDPVKREPTSPGLGGGGTGVGSGSTVSTVDQELATRRLLPAAPPTQNGFHGSGSDSDSGADAPLDFSLKSRRRLSGSESDHERRPPVNENNDSNLSSPEIKPNVAASSAASGSAVAKPAPDSAGGSGELGRTHTPLRESDVKNGSKEDVVPTVEDPSVTLPAALLGSVGTSLPATGKGLLPGAFANLPLYMDPRRLQQAQLQPNGSGNKSTARPFKAYPKDPLSLPLGYYGIPGMLPFPSIDSVTAQAMGTSSEDIFNQYRMYVLKCQQEQARSGGKPGATAQPPPPPPSQAQPQPGQPAAPSLPQKLPSPAAPVGSGTNPQASPSAKSSTSEASSTTMRSNSSSPTLSTTGTTPTSPSGADTADFGGGPSAGSTAPSASAATVTTTPSRKRGRTLPDEQKDEAYWERRRKNNEAAKRSRDSRRAKEDEIAIRAAFLEQENLKLRVEVAALKNETAKLRCMLYNS